MTQSFPPAAPAEDCSRAALDCVHQVLRRGSVSKSLWDNDFRSVVAAFDADRAGRTDLVDGVAVVRHQVRLAGERPAGEPPPWGGNAQLAQAARSSSSAIVVPATDGRSLLVTAPCHWDDTVRLFWLEGRPGRAWSDEERAAWGLAALALNRLADAAGLDGGAERGAQAQVQRRLEDTAALVGRLCHDFNNVLTGILGFAELGLAQLLPGSPGGAHVQEVYDIAQRGALLLSRLNTFTLRPRPLRHATGLPEVAAAEARHLRAAWGPEVRLDLELAADLPAVAVEAGALRQVLTALLDNARRAVRADGCVTLSARRAVVTDEECRDLLGNPAPGPTVLLTVADDGAGFTPEARRRVFVEPFFSTRPMHRGMGLATVFGLLRAAGGGLRIEHGAAGGTTVRVCLPMAAPEGVFPAAVDAVGQPAGVGRPAR